MVVHPAVGALGQSGAEPVKNPRARVAIVGVRGTFEPFETNEFGMGPTIGSIASELVTDLEQAMPGVEVELVGVDYPARALRYRHSRTRGVEFLRRILIDSSRKECQFAVIGLSQGADVVRHTLGSGRIPDALMRRIRAVVLLGDPGRHARESYQHGTDDPATGILARETLELPAEIQAHTWGYCLDGDEICANHRGILGVVRSGTHTRYGDPYTGIRGMAARFVLRGILTDE